MTRMLITGCRGLLGSNIIRVLKTQSDIELIGTDIIKSDLHDSTTFVSGNLLDDVFLTDLVKTQKPEIIINTVALPDVDRSESEPYLARKLNVETAISVATVAHACGCRVVHISTDQLFTGEKPFSTEHDQPQPVNNYARTKLEADKMVLNTINNSVIVRTNFYGWSPAGHGKTFGEWLFDSLRDHKHIKLITDYFYTPIEVSYFVCALKIVALSTFKGIINIAGTERCSKYDFGIAMAHEFGFARDNVVQVSSEEMFYRVARPKDISLSVDKFTTMFDFKLPDVNEGLKAFRQARRND